MFEAVPRLDTVFVPAGDPGGMEPEQFFESVGAMHGTLTAAHPDARVIVSNQCFNATQLDTFYALLPKNAYVGCPDILKYHQLMG